MVPNPRHLASDTRRLTKTQRALSRTTKGSARRRKAARRVRVVHHRIAERRATYLHTLTEQLATGCVVVAVEHLNVAGVTSSARGTVEEPGSKVRQKSGLNRSILDASPAEMRHQLDYKTRWNGSQLAVCDRWFPSTSLAVDLAVKFDDGAERDGVDGRPAGVRVLPHVDGRLRDDRPGP